MLQIPSKNTVKDKEIMHNSMIRCDVASAGLNRWPFDYFVMSSINVRMKWCAIECAWDWIKLNQYKWFNFQFNILLNDMQFLRKNKINHSISYTFDSTVEIYKLNQWLIHKISQPSTNNCESVSQCKNNTTTLFNKLLCTIS